MTNPPCSRSSAHHPAVQTASSLPFVLTLLTVSRRDKGTSPCHQTGGSRSQLVFFVSFVTANIDKILHSVDIFYLHCCKSCWTLLSWFLISLVRYRVGSPVACLCFPITEKRDFCNFSIFLGYITILSMYRIERWCLLLCPAHHYGEFHTYIFFYGSHRLIQGHQPKTQPWCWYLILSGKWTIVCLVRQVKGK